MPEITIELAPTKDSCVLLDSSVPRNQVEIIAHLLQFADGLVLSPREMNLLKLLGKHLSGERVIQSDGVLEYLFEMAYELEDKIVNHISQHNITPGYETRWYEDNIVVVEIEEH